MTRHIRLPLESTTTETHCNECPQNATPGWCDVFGTLRSDDVDDLRHADCRAAEIKNEDGAIIRLLALLVRAPTDDDGRPEIECSRETLVDMAMAARRELDADAATIAQLRAHMPSESVVYCIRSIMDADGVRYGHETYLDTIESWLSDVEPFIADLNRAYPEEV